MASVPLSPAAEPTLRQSIVPLIIIAVAIAAGFTMMQSFGIMGESAKTDMGLSDTALGMVQGVSAAIPLLLLSIPIGILVDRVNRVRLLLLFALIWTAGTFLTAAAPSVAILFMGRMLVGIGTTGALTAALSLAADLCRPEQRGRAMIISSVGKMIGSAAGFAVAGGLLAVFAAANAPQWFGAIAPWRSAQWILGLGSAVLILPLFFIREPARFETEAGPGAPARVVMHELWARRTFLLPLFVGQTSVVMADASAGIWVSPVLERFYGQQPGDFAGWFGAVVLGTGIFGSIIGGLVADWGQKYRARGGLILGAIAAAVVGIPAALFPIMPSVTGLAILVAILILAGTITGVVTSVALTVYLPNELRGLSIGAFIAIAGLIGFGVAPVMVTWVSSLLGGEQHLAAALAAVGVIVSVVSAIGFAMAYRRAPMPVASNEG